MGFLVAGSRQSPGPQTLSLPCSSSIPGQRPSQSEARTGTSVLRLGLVPLELLTLFTACPLPQNPSSLCPGMCGLCSPLGAPQNPYGGQGNLGASGGGIWGAHPWVPAAALGSAHPLHPKSFPGGGTSAKPPKGFKRLPSQNPEPSEPRTPPPRRILGLYGG